MFSLKGQSSSRFFRSFANLQQPEKVVLEDILKKIGGEGDFCLKAKKLDLVAECLKDSSRAEVRSS